MNEIQSKQRVADHGELFTPAWMAKAMLDLVIVSVGFLCPLPLHEMH
jgi:hypothetical protein